MTKMKVYIDKNDTIAELEVDKVTEAQFDKILAGLFGSVGVPTTALTASQITQATANHAAVTSKVEEEIEKPATVRLRPVGETVQVPTTSVAKVGPMTKEEKPKTQQSRVRAVPLQSSASLVPMEDLLTPEQQAKLKSYSTSKPADKSDQLAPVEESPKVVEAVATVTAVDENKNEDVPEHFVTGIKVRDGKPLYKLRYWCKCGGKGNHYVPQDTNYVKCFDCKNRLAVEPATVKGAGETQDYRDDYGNFFIARQDYVEVYKK